MVDNTGQSDSIIIYSFSNMIKMGNNKDLRTSVAYGQLTWLCQEEDVRPIDLLLAFILPLRIIQ